jgi:hypothetical protein
MDGLSSLDSASDPVEVGNPIQAEVKDRICRFLHDLRDSWVDCLVIEGPYLKEQVSLISIRSVLLNLLSY